MHLLHENKKETASPLYSKKSQKPKIQLRSMQNLQQSSECYEEGASPETHVQHIRERLFGIGSGKPINQRHAESSNRGIARLAMTAHCSPFHFICELMQNVADAQARLRLLNNSCSTQCSIVLSYLDPFADNDVRMVENSSRRKIKSHDENETGGCLLLVRIHNMVL